MICVVVVVVCSGEVLKPTVDNVPSAAVVAVEVVVCSRLTVLCSVVEDDVSVSNVEENFRLSYDDV